MLSSQTPYVVRRLVWLLLATGCSPAASGSRPDPLQRVSPIEVGPVIPFTTSALDEVSGTVRDPGSTSRFWMINDGGNPPDLIAVDAAGNIERQVRLRGARNVDWEDLAVGPCGTATCFYVADVGDNDTRRAFVTVYRALLPPEGASAVDAERLDLLWPGGPVDVEAATIDSAGTLWFVTKGRAGGSQHVMDVPSEAWDRSSCSDAIATPCRQAPFTARQRQTLSVPVLTSQDRITGAALSTDGRYMALRTYHDVLILPRAADGTLLEAAGLRCDLKKVQRQGEAIAWLSGGSLLLTTERDKGHSANQRIVRCPLPDQR
jgi:hypothetical protein